MPEAEKIWMDGGLRPWGEANVHVMTHALHYGSSVFEGIRAYDTPGGTAIFRLREHVERLFYSAKVYRMAIPYTPDQVMNACRAAVRENGLKAAYIRPIVFRGAGPAGVAARSGPIHTVVAAFEWGAYLGEAAQKEGVDACISSWRRLAPNTMPPGVKAGGNYLSSQLIAWEAKDNGFHEGIGLGADGHVSEGSGENLFLVMNGRLVTPPAAASILKGITRDAVIRLAADMGIETVEQVIPREALYAADEMFFTGTAVEITPVRSIDRLPVGNGKRPVTGKIQQAFFGLFDGSAKDEHGWLTPV